MIFLAPPIAGFMLFYIFPFVGGLYYAMINNPFEKHFVWFENFISIFSNQAFLLAFKNTVVLTVVAVPQLILFSFIVAVILKNNTDKMSVLRKIIIFPLAVPTVTVASIWLLFFENRGYINNIINAILHIEGLNWLGGGLLYVPISLIYIWKYSGFNIILFLAGLSHVPVELHEAAVLDGAGKLRQIRSITLPCIFPIIFFVTVLSIINSFKIFREIYVLCGSYPPKSVYVLQHFINNSFTKLNYEQLTTAAYIFSILILALVWVLISFENRFIADTR